MTEQQTEEWVGAVAFGDDGSSEADAAWQWIDRQTWGGWRLDVLTAVPIEGGPPAPEVAKNHVWTPDNPRLPSSGAGFGEVRHLRAQEDPRIMLWEAEGVTVIGPRGEGLWKSLSLGSTAEFLIAHPRTPLVVARNPTVVSHVLLAHDGSQHAIATREALCRMPWFRECKVTLLVVDDGRTDVADVIGKTTHFLDAEGGVTKVEVRRDEGNPADAVLNAMDELNPDLVAMGTRGRTGLQRLYVGSTASAVARAAECSVLVFSAD